MMREPCITDLFDADEDCSTMLDKPLKRVEWYTEEEMKKITPVPFDPHFDEYLEKTSPYVLKPENILNKADSREVKMFLPPGILKPVPFEKGEACCFVTKVAAIGPIEGYGPPKISVKGWKWPHKNAIDIPTYYELPEVHCIVLVKPEYEAFIGASGWTKTDVEVTLNFFKESGSLREYEDFAETTFEYVGPHSFRFEMGPHTLHRIPFDENHDVARLYSIKIKDNAPKNKARLMFADRRYKAWMELERFDEEDSSERDNSRLWYKKDIPCIKTISNCTLVITGAWEHDTWA